MLNINYKKIQATARAGQAATELAVFGAILIFILGAIVRSAAGNSYTQNQSFKAMRMAMLASWNGSKVGNTSRNSASVLFIEDRLSPDLNKYGALDRSPYISNGAGTFTYELMYPIEAADVSSNLPMMDIYINGQHFPFTTASYNPGVTITPPVCAPGGPYENFPLSRGECLQNQCLRNQREWVGGVKETQFESVIPVSLNISPAPGLTLDQTINNIMTANAASIFTELVNEGLITKVVGTGIAAWGFSTTSTLPAAFKTWFASAMFGTNVDTELNQIQTILQNGRYPYKLFYTMEVNGSPHFHVDPPVCTNHPCKDHELSTDIVTKDSHGVMDTWNGGVHNGDMMFDLWRNGDYARVESQLPVVPPGTVCSSSSTSMRCNIAWQWVATAATGKSVQDFTSLIGLNADNNQYPTYDIDGRLKEVTIYGVSVAPDRTVSVAYEDSQGGDIDGTWDANSCGPKPGLQSDAQIFTWTKDGTYLQIKEGKLYNPETGQVVRSQDKRDSVDLIQRAIQLSNNTGRFCNGTTVQNSLSGSSDPNPVEVCVDGSNQANSCFSPTTIKQTCYDTSDNMIFVRSRLEDRRGHFWMTDASGQLKVQ